MLPKVDCKYCGLESCRDMARAILWGLKTFSDCPLLVNLSLKVNNKLIPLSPYPRMVFEKVLKALISTLKGIPQHIDNITIEYTVKGERS